MLFFCRPVLRIFPALSAALLIYALAGCESIFFYPSARKLEIPAEVDLRNQDIYFESRDHLKLHAWLLKAVPPVKGNILFLHGNAENITSHVRSVFWLPGEGYNVFLPDYRGFGESEGSPDFAGAINDSADALKFFAALPQTGGAKIILFGQSMGGALALNVAANPAEHALLSNVIIDSAFSGFPAILRDKLNVFWVTSLMRYPLSWLVTKRYDPEDRVAAVSPLPLLLIAGVDDQIVPVKHSDRLFEKASEPKVYWRVEGAGHIEPLARKLYREKLLDYLQSISAVTNSN